MPQRRPPSPSTRPAFRPLIDRLGVSDEEAVQLLGRGLHGEAIPFPADDGEVKRLDFLKRVELAAAVGIAGPRG
jgi:hypothetical protein